MCPVTRAKPFGGNRVKVVLHNNGIPSTIQVAATTRPDSVIKHVTQPKLEHTEKSLSREGNDADGCLLGFSAVEALTLMMEAARTSETLVNFYQTTRRYNPEDSHLHTHRRENLKSY
jgi:hypothetical protein